MRPTTARDVSVRGAGSRRQADRWSARMSLLCRGRGRVSVSTTHALSIVDSSGDRVPLGACRPRRGHASPRPRRQPHPYGPYLPGLGGRRRIQRRARPASAASGCDNAVVTALADNPVGRLVEDLIFQGGVDQHLRWVKYDGVGRAIRNGLNFTERGFGVRAALGCSDRGHTAVSQLNRATSTGTSSSASAACAGSTRAASSARFRNPRRSSPKPRWNRRGGTERSSSYDLNYRESLWKADRRAGARPRGQPSARTARGRDDRKRRGLQRRLGFRSRVWTSISPRSIPTPSKP